jgi:phosphonopyruvate decarboxylase
MIESQQFVQALKTLGYSHFTGVPCSYLKPFINSVIDDPSVEYTGATSEGEAIAISFGSHLGGKKTVSMCQNSGLGNMVNPLTSLNHPFRVPNLLIVTWRGEPNRPDEPQHDQMGAITPKLLDVLEIPWEKFPLTVAEIDPVLQLAEKSITERSLPFALIMSEDSVAPNELRGFRSTNLVQTERFEFASSSSDCRVTRSEAIRLLLKHHSPARAIVATTGKTGRELFTISDSSNHFYVVGGMGSAAAIGLGITQALPQQPVTVLDGDGAILMKMGSMATIGFCQPQNLLHVVLDNEQHDSTGGQQTASCIANFANVAAAVNYRNAAFAIDATGIEEAVRILLTRQGPSMLHIKIKPGSPSKLGRPTIPPEQVKARFMQFIQQHHASKG